MSSATFSMMPVQDHLPRIIPYLSYIGDLQTLSAACPFFSSHALQAAQQAKASRGCVVVRGAYPAEFILNEVVAQLALLAVGGRDTQVRVIYFDVEDASELPEDMEPVYEDLWKCLALVIENNGSTLAVLKLSMPGLFLPDYSSESYLQVAGSISNLAALRCLDIQLTPLFMQHVKWTDAATRCRLLRFIGLGVESREESEADENFTEELPALFTTAFASVRTLRMTNFSSLPTKLALAEHFPHADTFIQPVFFKDKEEIAVLGKRFKRLDPRPLFYTQLEPPKVIESLEVAALAVSMQNGNNAVTWKLKDKLPALKEITELQVHNTLAENEARSTMPSFKPLSKLEFDRVKIDCLHIHMINSKLTVANFNKSIDELAAVLINTLGFRASLKVIDLTLNFGTSSGQITKPILMNALVRRFVQKIVPALTQLKLLRVELSGENYNQPALQAVIKRQDLKLIASGAIELAHFVQ